jgi:Beta-galactosidase trimerisation domain
VNSSSPRGLAIGLVAAAFVVPVRSAEPPARRNDIPYSMEVATPHVAWASVLPGGPIRGFFMPSISRGRDMVELMQRLALEPTTVSIDREWDINCWGIGDYYGHEERGDRDDFRIVFGYVEQDLTGDTPFEVMVIPGLNGWSRMTRPTRDAILRRVAEGAGLVLIHPFVGDVAGHPFLGDEASGDTRLWELSPLVGVPDDTVTERGYPALRQDAIASGRWEPAADHFITQGLDADLLATGERGGRFYRYESRGQVVVRAGGHPVVAVKSYGKGRVVAFAQAGEGFVPEPLDPVATHTYWDYWEYRQSLLARAVLWAAARESDLRLAALSASESGGVSARVETPQARSLGIEVTAKSESGEVLGTHEERREIAAGEATLTIASEGLRPASGWPGGKVLVNLILRDPATGATLNWGATHFEVEKAATIVSLRANSGAYREGDVLSVVTQAAGRLEDLRMRVTLTDDLDRVLSVESKRTGGEKPFFHSLEGFVGKRVSIAAALVDEKGRVVDELRHAPIPVVAKQRREKEYRALMSFETPAHNVEALRQRRLRAQAMDTGFTWGGELTDSLDIPRGYFGVYWYDRGPTTPEGLEKAVKDFERTGDLGSLQYLTRKELFKRTGDKRFLTRSPSLDDPEVLAILASVARTAARNKAPYNMDYYFVGDEGSLTSYTDPVDFDFGPDSLANFRRWLRQRYGSLDALNRSWQSTHTSWDAVMPETTQEARRSGVYPRWADHRTYMEVSFAHAYQVVRDAVVEGDPQGRIALSGTQVTTAYNGCDWWRLDRVIDDFLSYSGGNQWDFHRSFAKPGARIGFWTGYGRSGRPVQHEIWTAALSGVLFPNLFWSYSVVNPDFTFAKSGRDMGATFQALRFEGLGRLLMEAERVTDGIGIHYSLPSVHAAAILGYHESRNVDEDDAPGFPANRDGWAKGLTDLGLSYDFVAAPDLEVQGLDPKALKAFVLPLSFAVSPAEVANLEKYVRAGGTLIADGAAGVMDDHAAWQSAGLLSSLFGITTPPSSKRVYGTRVKGPVRLTAAGRASGLDESALAGLEALEADLKPEGATPLVRVGEAPALFVRRLGAGTAIYLNTLLDDYPKARSKGYAGSAQRAVLAAVLAKAGVTPAVEVKEPGGAPLGQTRIARYRFGGSDVIAILQEDVDVATLYGHDGVTIYDDSKLGRVAKRAVSVRLPRAGQVTNVRTGEDLGRTDSVAVEIQPGEALVLSVGEERPGLTLRAPAAAARGARLSLELNLTKPGAHLVRCHVVDPRGRFLPEYAANVAVDGARGSFVIPTALNDSAGRYRVTATDVVSGAMAEAVVELK